MVLAMGEYQHSDTRLPPGFLPPPSAATRTSSSSVTMRARMTLGKTGLGQPGGLSTGSDSSERPLKLFQVLSPSLVPRAKVFGNKLALKEEWICVDAPYFTAPGVCLVLFVPPRLHRSPDEELPVDFRRREIL